MGGHHHNGVAYNSINDMVRIAIIMMIHDACPVQVLLSTLIGYGQGGVLHDDTEPAILWWVSIHIVHPFLAYGPRVWIDGRSNVSDYGEAFSNSHNV